jgi:hypothetical protein
MLNPRKTLVFPRQEYPMIFCGDKILISIFPHAPMEEILRAEFIPLAASRRYV